MRKIDRQLLRYDPSHNISIGYFECPECQLQFYGGGDALHDISCPATGYEGCLYHIGPMHVAAIKQHGHWYGVSLADLQEVLPELLT